MRILRHDSCCIFDPRSTVDVKPYRGNDFFAKNVRKYGEDDGGNDGAVIKRNLSRSGNHIYFYDVIDTQTQMWLQTQMTAAYEEYVISNAKELAHSHSITENIYLHINSPGGSVTSALALYDFIKSFPMVCVGIVEGMAASGASILLCACAMRQMTKTSVVLCHELRHVSYGYVHETWRNIQDQYENDKFFMEKLKNIYLEETKIPAETIDEALSHDIYWGIDKCKEYELCDFVCGTDMTDDIVKMIDERVERRIKDNGELCDCEVCTEVVEEPTGKDKENTEAESSVSKTKTRKRKSKKVEEKTEEPSEETHKSDISKNTSND